MHLPPSLVETRAAVSSGRMTAEAAVRACWERAQAWEPALAAFAHLPATMPSVGQGTLSGITVGIKDLIDTGDMPTAYGSSLRQGHRPVVDAWIVAHLRGLGATLLGKTVTTEFAWRQPGPTRNPWNRAHTPGGSSSGSAAAVAAGIVHLAIGTQTFGSVIRPAAFCGVVGFKPTFGTFARDGVHPLSGSLDHVGLFARSVDDLAVAFSLLAPPAANLPDAAGAAVRFAALMPDDPAVEPAQRAAFQTAIDALRSGGATVEAVTLPAAFDDILDVADTLVAYEAAEVFGGDAFAGRIGAPLQALVDAGLDVSVAAYKTALERQSALRSEFARFIAPWGGLLTVPALGEAPVGLGSTGDPRFCVPWSVLGVPAITLPIGKGPAGLPLGIQIVGRWGEDVSLLRTAQDCAGRLPRASARGCPVL